MPRKGVEPPALRRYRLAHRKKHASKRRRPSRASRSSYMTKRKRAAPRRRLGRKRGRSGKPKKLSLVATLATIGLGAAVSGTVAAAASAAMGKAAPMLAVVGITTGSGLLLAAVAAKLLCSKSPAFRASYVSLIGSFGFRP